MQGSSKLFQFVKKHEETPIYSFKERYKLNQYHVCIKSDVHIPVTEIPATNYMIKEY
jgi:hypothetical protein